MKQKQVRPIVGGADGEGGGGDEGGAGGGAKGGDDGGEEGGGADGAGGSDGDGARHVFEAQSQSAQPALPSVGTASKVL